MTTQNDSDGKDATLSLLKLLRDIVDESDGVIGWHLNGEPAAWDELQIDLVGDIDRAIVEREAAPDLLASTVEFLATFDNFADGEIVISADVLEEALDPVRAAIAKAGAR